MPFNKLRILPECYADTTLVRFFVPDVHFSIHQEGCPEVAKTMLKGQTTDFKLVGVVDNDKKLDIHCQAYFKRFELVLEQNKIIHRRFTECEFPQELIILDKAIETFLLWNAQQIDLNIENYGFNKNPKQLGFSLKQVNIGYNRDYRRLLNDLSDSPGFVTLRTILEEIKS
jgi:hypothetical protein